MVVVGRSLATSCRGGLGKPPNSPKLPEFSTFRQKNPGFTTRNQLIAVIIEAVVVVPVVLDENVEEETVVMVANVIEWPENQVKCRNVHVAGGLEKRKRRHRQDHRSADSLCQ